MVHNSRPFKGRQTFRRRRNLEWNRLWDYLKLNTVLPKIRILRFQMHTRNNLNRSYLDSFQTSWIQPRPWPDVPQVQSPHRGHPPPPLALPLQPHHRLRKCQKHTKISGRSPHKILRRALPLAKRNSTLTPHRNKTRRHSNAWINSTLHQPRRNQFFLRNLLWRCIRRQVHKIPRN